nr:uncharacterized protein LOC117689102 [Crassostrea gigas]
MPEPSIDTESGERKQKIRWPPNNNKADWEQFNFDLDSILNTSLAGGIDRKVEAMATIMYNVGKERFGLEQVRQKQQQSTGHRNRRQQERASIRRDLRQLSKRYRVAPEEETAALAELRQGMRERLMILNRAERSRKRRKEKARARARFTANPFQFTSKLLGKKSSEKLLDEKAEVEKHLKEVHSDEKRDEELPEQPKLIQVCEPEHIFDESEPTTKKVRDVIRKARAASAPGPNGIPYKVYKNCRRLTRRLWKHIRVIWRRGRLADSWNQAEGCYIPKEENSKNLSQFRTISLLDVEGKILLSVKANRMTRYMLDNNYVDKAVQKGGVPGVSGCIEHTSVLNQIIREARDSCYLVISCKFSWIDATQTCAANLGEVSYSRKDMTSIRGIFQQTGVEILHWRLHNLIARTRSWHSHWLYNLSHTIRSSYEPTGEISRENE